MKKQKEAVFEAICSVKGTTSFSSAVTLEKDERAKVISSLLSDFKAGNIEYGGDASDSTKLSSYTSGLVSNWLRKDKRLNGNTTYTPANPGTRTGSSDDGVKAMKQLLAVTDDPEAKAEIQAEIDKRIGELKPKPEINVEALPEALRHLASS